MGNIIAVLCAGGCETVLADECFFDEDTESLYCDQCKTEKAEKMTLQETVSAEVIIGDEDDAFLPERRIWAKIGKPDKAEWMKPLEVKT